MVWRVALILVVAAAFVQRMVVAPNADEAWLLTVVERWLDGQRLYVDILEANPPFSIYLYVVPVLIARLVGASAEFVTDILVVAAALAGLWFCGSALGRAGILTPRQKGPCAVVCAVCLLLLPSACFSEREQIALIAFLPYLSIARCRAEGYVPARRLLIVAGICGGIVMSIKFWFALALFGASVAATAYARTLQRMFVAENWVAGAVAAAYAASTFVLHPAFWSQMIPLVGLTYVPTVLPPWAFLFGRFLRFSVCFAASAALLWQYGRGIVRPLHVVGLAASVGFYGALVLQGKGMPYHFLPALTLTLMTTAVASVQAPAADRSSGRGVGVQWLRNRMAPMLVLGWLASIYWCWFAAAFDLRAMVPAVQAVAPHPRTLSIGYDMTPGAALARGAGGLYVGRSASQWIADMAQDLGRADGVDPARRRKLAAAEERDRAMLRIDLETKSPDALIVQRGPQDWLPWAKADSRIAEAMSKFEPVGHYASAGIGMAVHLDLELYRRRPENR